VRKLVGEKHPDVVCLQETKLQLCDDFFMLISLGATTPHAFSFQPFMGALGGLLIV
jgi:hypothetical protein